MVTTVTTAALGFGGLDIKLEEPLFGILDPGEAWIAATADGADWGTAEAVIATDASMLMDGDTAKVTRFGNRSATLPLKIVGESLDVVAAGEAAVMAEVNKGRNTFTWTPPGPAETSVFDVVYSKLDFKFDDLAETNQVTRYFTLKLECLPFARRAELTTVVADPIPSGAADVTILDDGSFLTGWTSPDGVLSLAGGGVLCTPTDPTAPTTMSRSGLEAEVADELFVVVDVQGSISSINLLGHGGTIATDIIATEQVGASRRRWYLSPAASIVVDGITVTTSRVQGSPSTATVYEISTTDQLPFSGSRRQRSFSALIEGTARTSADLRVELTSMIEFASDFLIYTAPTDAALAPPLRSWLTSSGTVTTDTTAVSGARQPLTSASVYEIPAANIGAGMHLLVARLRRGMGADGVTLSWSASLDSTLTTAATDEPGSIALTLTPDWEFYQLGVLNLPPVAVAASSAASVIFTLDSDAHVLLDEVYLFNLDSGVLTWITDLDAGTAAPLKIAVRSANLDSDVPSWVVGFPGTSQFDVSVAERAVSPGVHVFDPGLLDVFVITPGATEQSVYVDFYERSEHHVPPRRPS